MFDKEQVEALRRQVEEDYRSDMSAVERLQRRYATSSQGIDPVKRQIEEDYRLDSSAIERLQRRFASSNHGVTLVKESPAPERNVTVLPTLESQAEAQPDDLTNTLRGMFTAHRR